MKPYYEQDGITIYNADCRDVLPGLEPVDLVLTDPPYGISLPTDYSTRGRAKLAQGRDYPPVHGDGEAFIVPPALTATDAMLWGANYYADQLPPMSGWLVWDKLRPAGLDQADAEVAWTNCVKGVRVYRHLWNGMIRASEHGVGWHPTQKPASLMSWCLTWGDWSTVLDPYMGSGPVLVAAKLNGNKATGIEIEERYCEIAANRLAQGVLDFEVNNEPITAAI